MESISAIPRSRVKIPSPTQRQSKPGRVKTGIAKGLPAGMEKGERKRLVRDAQGIDFKRWLLGWCDTYKWTLVPYLGHRPMTRIQQVEWTDGLDRIFKFEDRGGAAFNRQRLAVGGIKTGSNHT